MVKVQYNREIKYVIYIDSKSRKIIVYLDSVVCLLLIIKYLDLFKIENYLL